MYEDRLASSDLGLDFGVRDESAEPAQFPKAHELADGSKESAAIGTAIAGQYALVSRDALWFTEDTGNRIGRITTGGAITEFATPAGGPSGIAKGPDGAM